MDGAQQDDFRTLANRRMLIVAGLLFAVLAGGTAGYKIISGGSSSFVDCLYMTVITVTTIGYSEIVDLGASPGGRVFTMLIALSGIGIITYALTSFTALAVDGELQARWRRRSMLKTIHEMSAHHLICGWNGVARQILRELLATRRPVVVLAPPDARAGAELDGTGACWLEGDPTSDDLLEQAGVVRAAGVFAATEDDPTNIVICLSVRRLNPKARIVAACRDAANAVKMQKVGADATISVIAIAGMRMASEMVRPATVSFLDTMLREKESPLRVEEVVVPGRLAGSPISSVDLGGLPRTLLLAVRCGGNWVFKPAADRPMAEGEVLIVMTSPEERKILTDRLAP